MGSPIKNTVVSALTLAFLGGAAIDRKMAMVPPEDTSAYQASIRNAYAQLPLRIGDWIGQDTPVPQAATAILHPNVLLSRSYTNFVTGRSASLLLTQCADARDMAGHYPPNCYPNAGWIMQRQELRNWTIDGLRITGKEYLFLRTPMSANGITVRNFMVLPDGSIAPDMESIVKSTSVRRRFYGAGQVQVICDSGLPREEQEEIFTSLVEGHMSIITAILAGIHDVPPPKSI